MMPGELHLLLHSLCLILWIELIEGFFFFFLQGKSFFDAYSGGVLKLVTGGSTTLHHKVSPGNDVQ